MSDVEIIFDFWQHCSKHPKARLDPSRAKAIIKALSWRYTVDDLKLAILGCCSNPWYADGQNDRQTIYTGLTLILRDADHIDRFMDDGQKTVNKALGAAREENERRNTRRADPENVRRLIDATRKRFK